MELCGRPFSVVRAVIFSPRKQFTPAPVPIQIPPSASSQTDRTDACARPSFGVHTLNWPSFKRRRPFESVPIQSAPSRPAKIFVRVEFVVVFGRQNSRTSPSFQERSLPSSVTDQNEPQPP